MAYNPFNIFRRNQKAIFAVLTVFIMIMFTLSSGVVGGDFFDWIPRWLGSKSRKGDVVATMDGRKVYGSELDHLRFQRVMANRFMSLANDVAIGETRDGAPIGPGGLVKYIADRQGQIAPENWRLLMEGPRAVSISQLPDAQAAQVLAADMMAGGRLQGIPPDLAVQVAMQQVPQYRRMAAEYTALVNSSTLKPAEKEVLRAVQALQNLNNARTDAVRMGEPQQFFVNAPNRNQRDLLDFMLWQKKADQLGIQFTTDDIKNLVKSEFYGFFASDVAVRQVLQKDMQGFSMDAAWRAIGEEFRVRTAQAALLGSGAYGGRPDKTFGGAPLFTPPYEVFDFYRDKTSPTLYEVVAVPAANFVDQVTGKPTDQELRDLYLKYKDDEPNPGRETPGFKEPRKLKVGWVSVTGTEPYYQKLAEEQLRAAAAYQMQTEAFLTVPLPGVGPGWAGIAALPFGVPDLLLTDAYEKLVREHQSTLDLNWSRSSIFGFGVLDTSVVRPQTLAAAAGGLGGSLAGFGGPFEGLGLAASTVWATETRDRLKAGLPGLLAILPGPGILGTGVAAEASFRTAVPKPLPLAAVKPMILKRLADHTAQWLAREDLEKFTKEVKKLSEEGKGKNTQLVKDYIAKFAADRGWQTGVSQDARDEWTLEEDPGLAPVKAAFDKLIRDTLLGSRPVQFGKKLFWDDFQTPNPGRPATGSFKPEYYPGPPRDFDRLSPEATPAPMFAVWRAEDVPSKTAVNFEADKEKVLKAWKRLQARNLAKAAADALAADIRKSDGDSVPVITQNIRDLVGKLREKWANDPKAQDRVKVFTIPGVAPLAQATGVDAIRAGMAGTLLPFFLPPSADIPYPTQEMQQALLDERTKPAKAAFVLADKPKDTYYVATPVERSVKQPDEFKTSVYTDIGFGLARERAAVLEAQRAEARARMIESVLGLLKKEFKYEETEEQKKKLDEGAKRGET